MFKKEWCLLFDRVKRCFRILGQKVSMVMDGCRDVLNFVRRVEFSSSDFGVPAHLIRRWACRNGVDETDFPVYLNMLEERGFLYEISEGVYSSVPRDVVGGL